MEWFWLFIVGILYCICAFLTYKEEWRYEWWYLPISSFFGSVLVLIWYLVIRHIGDKDRIYFYSLCWDGVLVGVYYFLPILLFGVRLERMGIVGLALILVGLVMIKLSNAH